MRRLFIMRKDLHMSPGKLAAQVAHCAEAYWLCGLRRNAKFIDDYIGYGIHGFIDKDIMDEYVNDKFVKTVCEARSKNHLLKAKTIAEDLGLTENINYGLIYDGTTLTGIWFCPLPDEMAHMISKKYQLYK